MIRILLLTLLVIGFYAAPAQAQFEDRFPQNFKKLPYIFGDFGDYVWGVTKEDVADIEYKKLTPLLQDLDNALFYQISYRSLKSTISYEFNDNKLYRGQIQVYERQGDPQKWLDLLLEVQIDFEKAYGKPIREEFNWGNQEHKPFPDEWRFALVQGDLKILIQWRQKDTLITARLETIEDFRPGLNIIFQKLEKKPEEAPKPLDFDDEDGIGDLILP